MALSKTGRFLSKAEILGVGVFFPISILGGIFLGHPGARGRDVLDKNFKQVAFFCCFRQEVAGMSWDLGRDIPDLENFTQENSGLIFRTLKSVSSDFV